MLYEVITWIHREVRILPIPQHAESLKLLTLNLIKLLGILTAEIANGHGIECFLLLAEIFQHLMFDR